MHTLSVLQKCFRESLPEIHRKRSQALTAAVDAVAHGARVTITGLGRSLTGTSTRIKHRVKRMDRLVGNRLLGAQRKRFYQAIVLRLLAGCPQPIILVDWSDFSVDRQQQLLCASLAVGSRAITLFEELHPYRKLGNRLVQHRFLDQLKAMMPTHCLPIVIADAGFRVPFYRHVGNCPGLRPRILRAMLNARPRRPAAGVKTLRGFVFSRGCAARAPARPGCRLRARCGPSGLRSRARRRPPRPPPQAGAPHSNSEQHSARQKLALQPTSTPCGVAVKGCASRAARDP